MRSADVLTSAVRALTAHGARSWLTLLAVAFGAAAVVLLSSLGEGPDAMCWTSSRSSAPIY